MIPQSDEDQLKKEVQDVLFKSVYITKEQYMKLSFWYESDPCIPTYEDEEVNISLGETVSKLKEVIFDLNKNAQVTFDY